jgi:hypothetical protein
VIPDDALARVIHEANRAWNVHLDDPAPDPPWDALPDWHKQMITERITQIRAGLTPAQIHAEWITYLTADGWTWASAKDPGRKTHPCLRPYAELPGEQQVKDDLAVAIVTALLSQETAQETP